MAYKLNRSGTVGTYDRKRNWYWMRHMCITTPRHVIDLCVSQKKISAVYSCMKIKYIFQASKGAVVTNVSLERWIQHISGGFKTVNLSWVNKIAVIGYTWLFVYA